MADDGDSEGFKEQHHDNYETKPLSILAMSNCNSQKSVNRTTPAKDMYWFAQTSEPSADESPQAKNNSFSKKEDSYWFAHGGLLGDLSLSNPLDDPDGKESLLQKEREERVKLFKEQQEEERRKRQQELEQSFMVAKKYREQQEAERRRKIEEARVREEERRQQVEERKRQIWEAEQERKEAILRRNLEREARIEARRNAHRNSMSFAFGSSTPRTFDLDLAALSAGRGPAQSVLMSAVSGRRSEEREFGAKRATSACSLDRKFDIDSLYDDNSDISRDCSRESSLEPSPSRVNVSKQIALEHMNSDRTKACMTMLDDDASQSCGGLFFHSSTIPGWLRGSGALVEGEDLMSRSMVSLSSVSRGRRRTDLTPIVPRDRSTTPILISRVMKDNSQSPSRPQSSMSRTSEISTTSSQASGVLLRPKPAPRRPRPVSIAGTTVGSSSAATPPSASKRPERPTRPTEKSAPKTARARSAEPEQCTEEGVKPRSAPKKPVPPPKTSEILAKAKNRPVPSKDNLRKRVASAEPTKKPSAVDAQVKNLPASGPEMKKLSSPEREVKILPSLEHELKTLPSPEREIKILPTLEPEMKKLPSPEHEVNNLPASQPEVKDALETENKIPSQPEVKSLPTPTNSQVILENVDSVPSDKEKDAREKPVAPDLLSNQPTVVSDNVPETQGRNENEPLVESTPLKTRITSEEEARAALAEKRRLAREQAEREAELERQRQEELRKQEEEQRRQEELEQKRLEEEQIRLAELHRKLEEEKLRKAIEEQQQREKEERERKEEEARQKAEKEEQERKAREESEKQRLELEERLRKEEEERAERKRRVEQIMSRTRAKANHASSGSQPNSQNSSKPTTPAEENKTSPSSSNPPVLNSAISGGVSATVGRLVTEELLINYSDDTSGNRCTDVTITTHENNVSNNADSATNIQTEILQSNSDNNTGNHVDQLQSVKQGPVLENGHCKESIEFPFEKTSLTHDLNHASNRTSECIDISLVAQTNGYSSHEEMSCTTSPEEKSETSDASGLGSAEVISQPCLAIQSEQSEFDQLIDLGQVEQSSNSHLDNYLINSDDLNSNLISPGKPFIAFEDNISNKQETSVTDLLS